MNLTSSPIRWTALVVLAAVAVTLWQQNQIRRLTAQIQEAQAASIELAGLQTEVRALRASAPDRAELERLRTAEADGKAEVARLRAAVTEARPRGTETAPQAAESSVGASDEDSGVSAGMTGLMKGAIEQQLFGQLERMKTKLQLTPEQEEAIRAVFNQQVEQAVAAAGKMFGGGMSREEMKELQASSSNPEETIKALLTPEQLDRYQEYKQEEAVANARLVANAELLQMQGALSLSTEQQDQVFDALYDHTVKQLSGELTVGAAGAQDPGAAFEAMIEQKVNALEGVLSPVQLESYRKMQQQQAGFIKRMLPTAEPGPAPAP